MHTLCYSFLCIFFCLFVSTIAKTKMQFTQWLNGSIRASYRECCCGVRINGTRMEIYEITEPNTIEILVKLFAFFSYFQQNIMKRITDDGISVPRGCSRPATNEMRTDEQKRKCSLSGIPYSTRPMKMNILMSRSLIEIFSIN